MNVFQVLNQRKSLRVLTQKERLHLIGNRISAEVSGPSFPLSQIRFSQAGIIQVENNPGLNILQGFVDDPEVLFLNKHKRFTISSNNKIKSSFDTFMYFLPLVSIISSMYFLGFEYPTTEDQIFDTIIWVIFIIDFVLCFFTEFHDKKKRKQVRNLRLIASNYAKGRMIFDLVALLPLRYAGSYHTECVLRLCRLGRVSDVFKLINIDLISEKIASRLYDDGTMAKQKLMLKIYTIWEILMQVMKMFFIAFVLACLWFAYVQYIQKKYNETYNFITYFNIIDNPQGEQFIKTWYFIVTTLLTVGYGDFFAVNKYEQIFAIFLLLIGPTWFAFAMGNAIALINSLGDLRNKKESKKNLQKWIASVEESYKEVPFEMKQDIMKHYAYMWKNERLGSLFNKSQENDFSVFRSSDPIFSVLPEDMQEGILQYLFSDVFYNFSLFFKAFDKAKYQLCRFLEPRVYSKRTEIVKYHSPVHEILFVDTGSVQVSTYHNSMCISLFTIKIKCVIGDYFVLNNIQSSVEFKATSNVKGFSIPVYAFKEIAKLYDLNLSLYNQMVKPIYKRFEEAAMDALRRFPEETKEREEVGLSDKVSPMTGDSLGLYDVDKIEVYLEDSEKDVIKEMESNDKLLKECNWRRIKILKSLKEQISETVFDRLRIV